MCHSGVAAALIDAVHMPDLPNDDRLGRDESACR